MKFSPQVVFVCLLFCDDDDYVDERRNSSTNKNLASSVEQRYLPYHYFRLSLLLHLIILSLACCRLEALWF